MTLVAIRPAAVGDRPLLEAMLDEAVNWHPGRQRVPRERIHALHPLWHYVEDWPRAGDLGLVAETGIAEGVGAAWARRFPWDDPGFGFVDERVPEVTIGVDPAWRGRGVGARLLGALVAKARDHGASALSLSVEAANPALRMYLRLGFRIVASANGTHTMLLDLRGT